MPEFYLIPARTIIKIPEFLSYYLPPTLYSAGTAYTPNVVVRRQPEVILARHTTFDNIKDGGLVEV